MEINHFPKESNMLPSRLVGFMVHANQVGIGILGYQRIIAKEAGHDAWISVALAGLLAHVTVWVIIQTLRKYPSADLFGIHQDVYGKWLGGMLSLMFVRYFILAAIVVLRNYIEVIQTWIFPEVSTWLFSLIFIFLALYTVLGGIRVIAGYTFITVVIVIWLLLDLYFPLQFARWYHLLPIMEADLLQIWKGTLAMSLTIIGFEIIYAIYPFVKEKERAGKAAQLGILVTNMIYTFLMVVTLVFFSEGQLAKTIWATLHLKKMVYLPFLERFEFIAISLWLLVIMPNVMLYIWSAARGCKRLFGWNQRKLTYILFILIFMSTLFFLSRQEVNRLNDITSRMGFYFAFVYPYVLYLLVIIKQAWKRKRGNASDESVSE